MSFHHSVRSRRLYRSTIKKMATISAARQWRILVVDDEPIQRRLVAEDLLLDGYRVSEAGNAFQALALLSSSETFDVLLTDIDMPGDFNGIELARLVRDTVPATRIILISGEDHPLDTIGSVDLYVRKPVTSVRLRLLISRLLARVSPLNGAVARYPR